MKGFLLLTLLVVIAGVYADNSGGSALGDPQPADCNGSLPVYSPDPDDCSKFFECANNYQYHMTCGELHFNPVLQVCDFPDHAGCQANK